VWIYADPRGRRRYRAFSTIVLVALSSTPPTPSTRFLAPIGVAHCVFGFVSGFVTFHLMKSIQKLRPSCDIGPGL